MPTISPQAAEAAHAAQRKWAVPASVSLAQYIVESGGGVHEPANSNNPFGIQAAAGQPYVSAASHEYRNGVMVPVVERFRKFASLEEAFDEHARLLATARPYRHAMALVHDPNKFAQALTGVYATAPHYGDALVHTMQVYGLYQYDIALQSDAAPAASGSSPLSAPPPGITLSVGSSGDSVRWLQRALGVKIDGHFGSATRDAVVEFQRRLAGPLVDGIASPATIKAIEAMQDHPHG